MSFPDSGAREAIDELARRQAGKTLKIVKGPTKFDLMMSLFMGTRIAFDLEGGSNTQIVGVAQSVQAEDGSHESWNIKLVSSSSNQIYYHTGRGIGHISFSKERLG